MHAPGGLLAAMRRARGSRTGCCSPLRPNLPIGSRLRWSAMGKADIRLTPEAVRAVDRLGVEFGPAGDDDRLGAERMVQRSHHPFGRLRASVSSTAIRSATPISTCPRISDCARRRSARRFRPAVHRPGMHDERARLRPGELFLIEAEIAEIFLRARHEGAARSSARAAGAASSRCRRPRGLSACHALTSTAIRRPARGGDPACGPTFHSASPGDGR